MMQVYDSPVGSKTLEFSMSIVTDDTAFGQHFQSIRSLYDLWKCTWAERDTYMQNQRLDDSPWAFQLWLHHQGLHGVQMDQVNQGHVCGRQACSAAAHLVSDIKDKESRPIGIRSL